MGLLHFGCGKPASHKSYLWLASLECPCPGTSLELQLRRRVTPSIRMKDIMQRQSVGRNKKRQCTISWNKALCASWLRTQQFLDYAGGGPAITAAYCQIDPRANAATIMSHCYRGSLYFALTRKMVGDVSAILVVGKSPTSCEALSSSSLISSK